MNLNELKLRKSELMNLVLEDSITKEITRFNVLILNILELESGYTIIDYKDIRNNSVEKLMIREDGIGFPSDHQTACFELADSMEVFKKIVPSHLNPYEQPIWISGYVSHKSKVDEIIGDESMRNMVNKFKSSFTNQKLCSETLVNTFIKGLMTVKTEIENI